MTSCFTNDLSDCPPDSTAIKIYFKVETTTYRSLKSAAEVDHMSLFVFDSEQRLVTVLKDDQCRLSDNYYMTLSLDRGDYTFVAWANLRGCYGHTSCETGTPFSELEVYLHRDAGNDVNDAPHPLFYGSLSSQKVTAEEDQVFVLPIDKNNNIVNVTTEGLPPSGDSYRLIITDSNGSYKFDNSFASDTEEINYISGCLKDNDSQLSGSLTIMRLSPKRKLPILKLENTDTKEIIYQANLIELINKLQEKDATIDISKSNVYNIVLRFDADMNVSVSINGWNVINDETEI
jgi:hypothetical protein